MTWSQYFFLITTANFGPVKAQTFAFGPVKNKTSSFTCNFWFFSKIFQKFGDENLINLLSFFV